MTQLFCIIIPGPDDIYAAPDKETAERMATVHNEAMRNWLETEHSEDRFLYLTHEDIQASVAEWPYSEVEHAEALVGFDTTEWEENFNA